MELRELLLSTGILFDRVVEITFKNCSYIRHSRIKIDISGGAIEELVPSTF